VPELGDLIDQFEKEDEAILQFNEKQKQHVKNLEVRGFEPDPRYEIVNQQAERIELLNNNIQTQRQQ
jgi:hypothetical protein